MARTKLGSPIFFSQRRELRMNMTEPERILWFRLQSRKFFGLKFRRQHGIGDFIVDFFCPEKRVAIEIDGETHAVEEKMLSDRIREKYLRSIGITPIRYFNHDVMSNMEGIMEDLAQKMGINPAITTSPNPSLQRRGK